MTRTPGTRTTRPAAAAPAGTTPAARPARAAAATHRGHVPPTTGDPER